jgi:hypothetical protein
MAEELFQQRPRKGRGLDHRQKASAFDPPECGLGKLLAPEDLPASDRPWIDVEQLGQHVDSAGGRTLPHRGDQDDHGAQVHLASQKTHRRRCHPLAATFPRAAEAQPPGVFLGEVLGRTAPRLPGIVGAM